MEKSSGKSETLKVDSNKSQLSSDDIERMVREAEEHKEDDDRRATLIEVRNQFENEVYRVKTKTEDNTSGVLTEDEKTTILEEVSGVMEWLSSLNDTSNSVTIEDIRSKQESFSDFMKPYVLKLSGEYGGEDQEQEEKGDGPTVEEVD